MIKESTFHKLKILSDSAKYDVSCSSSGSRRNNREGELGNTKSWGVCHSFTEDGRCISLLKIMLTNYCQYDCAYCVSRRSNDIKRTSFKIEELVNLTIEFYRRNYIEGLFLSSGIFKSPDYTMERMVKVIKELRNQRFNGYIHMKSIPGSSPILVKQAGQYADRLSVNIEIPTESNLKILAPEKNFESIFSPIKSISRNILENNEERKKHHRIPKFAPAGQSTQLIVGATNDSDLKILSLSSILYYEQKLKRVYYSGFIPVNNNDKRLPMLPSPPLKRENRLYQADWLLRFYKFKVNEIVNTQYPLLDLDVDPKLSYALRNPSMFPVDINKADYEILLRVPGIGVKSAKMILSARRYGKVTTSHLEKMGIILKRAQYFITSNELGNFKTVQELTPEYVKKVILGHHVNNNKHVQLRLFP